MCTWQAGAMFLGSYLQMSEQRKRANEQAVAQDRMLKQEQEEAEMNAKLKSKQAEQMAEAYARKQKELNDRLRLTQGANAASAGASGVSSTTGSAWDLAEASDEQFRRASKDLLSNQRNDIFGLSLDEYNLRKSAENLQKTREQQKRAYRRNMRYENFNSMLSTAMSIKGYRAKHKKLDSVATGGDSIYNPFMDNRAAKGYNEMFGPNINQNYSLWSERLPSLGNPWSVTSGKGSLQGFNRQFGYASPNGSFGINGLRGKRVKL